MKTELNRFFSALALFALASLGCQPATAFAQGVLTPPGAPAPTMKTLDQIEARTPISSLPYTITNPGSYYLTTNVTGVSGTAGITVSSGNVTIDLNGFALFGVAGSYSGVAVQGTYTNITVRNGTVSGWPINGVDAWSFGYPRNLDFEKLTVSANGNIGIYTEAGSTVRDSFSIGNGGAGIISSGGLIADCVVRDNSGDGIDAIECTVRHCEVQNSGNYGMYVSSCVVSDCLIMRSAADGIDVYGPGCQIIGNTLQGDTVSQTSGHASINVLAGNNRIEGNHVTTSGSIHWGISVPSNSGNVVVKNTVSGAGSNSYFIAGNNAYGTIITLTGALTVISSSNPWANFAY